MGGGARSGTPGGFWGDGHLENCRQEEGKALQVNSRALGSLRGAGEQALARLATVFPENQVLGDQATKGNRWMPGGREPTKGVAHDDTPRGAASRR
jgi:hypothetical protein